MSAPNQQIDWMHWIYRLIALIIDSIIAWIPAAIITFFVLIGPWWIGVFVSPFIYGIVLVLYTTILEVAWGGQTIGKKLLGLQVKTTNGSSLDFGKDFMRNISKIYWIFLFLDWLLGVIGNENKNQRFLDRSTGTIVVGGTQAYKSTTAPPPPPPPPPPA